MGAEGSGCDTATSQTWDILDFMWATLNRLERSIFAEHPLLTREWIETTKADLQRLQGQLKDALERERSSWLFPKADLDAWMSQQVKRRMGRG